MDDRLKAGVGVENNYRGAVMGWWVAHRKGVPGPNSFA